MPYGATAPTSEVRLQRNSRMAYRVFTTEAAMLILTIDSLRKTRFLSSISGTLAESRKYLQLGLITNYSDTPV